MFLSGKKLIQSDLSPVKIVRRESRVWMKVAGVVVTGKNCSAVSTTPVINLSPVSTHTADHWKLDSGVVGSAEQFIAGVVDTADKHSFAIISAKFWKKIWNDPNGMIRGPGDTDSWKKLKLKISCQTLFNVYFVCMYWFCMALAKSKSGCAHLF